MDIKLMPVGRPAETFVFPMLPESVSGDTDTRYRTYSIISKGNVLVPRGLDTNEFSWSGEFFGAAKKNERIVKREHWKEPTVCVDLLRKWMDDGEVLNLIVTETWINQDVTISRFKPTAYGAFGNIKYDITLRVYKNLQVYTTDELGITSSFDLQKINVNGRTPRLDLSGQTYTIKDGDTLVTIAIYVYGDGGLWEQIWKKNKKVLNKAAKDAGLKNADNGARLVAGTTITLP